MTIDALERAELEQLRLATRLSGVATWSFEIASGDLANARLAVGSNVFESLGYERGETPGGLASGVALAIHPDDQAHVFAALQACSDGKPFEAEYRARHKDGSVRWKLGRGVATRDASGRPILITGTSVDVTRLKEAEAEARAGRELLEIGMTLAGYSVTEIDRRGITTDDAIISGSGNWEQRGTTIGGANAIELMTRLIVDEDLPAALDHFRAINRGERRDPIEFRSRNAADGSVQWRLAHGKLICDERGQPTRYVGASVDIHKIKLAEQDARRAMQKIKTAEEQARRAIEQLRLATRLSDVYLWNFELVDGDLAKAKITSSDAWEPLGYQPHEVPSDVGSGMAAVFADDQPRVWAALQASVDGTTDPLEVDYRTHHKDGSLHWNLARGVTLRDAAGRATRTLGTIVDVTRLRQAEEEVRVAEEQARKAVQQQRLATDLSGVGVWGYELGDDGDIATATSVFDVDGVISGLGYDVDEFPPTLPARLGAVVHPDDRSRMYVAVQDCFAGVTPMFDAECRFLHKNGSVVWRLVRGIVTRDASGRPTSFMGTAVDITQLKETQADLRRSEEQFRHIFENAAVGMILSATDGRILESNARWREFLGYSGEQVTGRTFYEFMVPEEVAADRERVRSVLRGDVPSFSRDKRYIRKDGTIVWGNVTVSVVQRDADGTPTRTMGILQDISERKELEVEIEKAHALIQLAMRGSEMSVFDGQMRNGDFTTSTWTHLNMWEPMGIDPATAPTDYGGIMALIIHPDDFGHVAGRFQAAIQAKSSVLYLEHRVMYRDGTLHWWLSRGTLLFDEAGALTRLIGTTTDITRLKQIEVDLLRAREAAESANRAKDEFLANVSHEIRTPMNAILGMTELAIDAAPTEHQRQLLSTVRSAAKNLLTIINDLLDFSKIASGKLTLDRIDFSLRAAVGDTLRALAVRAHRRGLELLCHVRPDVPDALDGDAGRLRQVLMNLVGNAIKFTPQGEVEIDVAAEPSTGSSVSLIFTVRDTGIGIARDKQAAIFHAFEQEDSSTTRKYGGTGLGLTISAQLASLMDGDITVQSAPGCGSTFRFTARFARSTNPDAAMLSPERLANLRVLVVDDSETNRHVLVEWLTSWRMQPTSASTAAEALVALASAHVDGSPFSIVLLDARMPDTDGVALANEIRRRWNGAAPRMILLSSEDNAQLATLARDSGVLAYLLKPVQQSELLEAIWAAMNLDLTMPSAGQPEHSRPLRILVAEDNELNVTLLRELLSQRRHLAQFAGDGRAALELALQQNFDLMLLDLHMPELDGFEVVEAIRDHERGTNQHLRIVALTARSSARDRERCLAAGMDEFLAKPIEAAALWATIEQMVAKWPLAALPSVEPGLIDARAVLRACGGRAPILEKLRLVFQRTLPLQMSRVRAALATRDLRELREAAHQLVATVGAFSTITASVASALEDAAIREDHESCATLVDRLGSLCDALLEATATLTIESLSL